MKHKKLNKKVDSQDYQYLCNVKQNKLTLVDIIGTHFSSEDVINTYTLNYFLTHNNSVDVLDFAKDAHITFGFNVFCVQCHDNQFHFVFDDDLKVIHVSSCDIDDCAETADKLVCFKFNN